MCECSLISSKSLCRVFGFLNVMLGLIVIYHWENLLRFGNTIVEAPGWNSLLPVQEYSVRIMIEEKCGELYLHEVSPKLFGGQFKKSMKLFLAAATIYVIKGFIQFIMTCFGPIAARTMAVTVLLIELGAAIILCFALHIFRGKDLCLMEHTDLLQYPGQQSLLTIILVITLLMIKTPEIISLICFIRVQTLFIALGETRSKGDRRAEAFLTPMNSRINSYIKGSRPSSRRGGSGGSDSGSSTVLRRFKIDSNGLGVMDEVLMNFQMNSDEDDEGDEDHDHISLKKVSFGMNGEMLDLEKGGFIEVDLNENESNPDLVEIEGRRSETESIPLTIFHKAKGKIGSGNEKKMSKPEPKKKGEDKGNDNEEA